MDIVDGRCTITSTSRNISGRDISGWSGSAWLFSSP